MYTDCLVRILVEKVPEASVEYECVDIEHGVPTVSFEVAVSVQFEGESGPRWSTEEFTFRGLGHSHLIQTKRRCTV
jgi:hypothetical protein